MTNAGTGKATAETVADFRGRHEGASFLVCGCGESLNGLTARPDCLTIGVNDVGRLLDPDYLVVVNPAAQFLSERYRYIQQSKARAVFSQYPDLPLAHAPLVQFALGAYNGTDFSDPRVLHHTRNSPYVAVCLAIHMGAKRIGLIGVDFTDNHFFGTTGRHPLASQLGQIDREYRNLATACERVGIQIYNVSPISRLTAFPRKTLAEFATVAHRNASPKPVGGSLRIVSYATTPIAGVPAILARCITARTPHTARCVWATNDYGNGVSFDGDLEWRADPAAAEAALAEADLVIVHNGKLDGLHRAVLAGKPVVTMAHNYQWNVDTGLVRAGFPGVVVGQYQAALPEFAGWDVVPNPVPLWEQEFTPEPKGDAIRIAYTPSGRHESYPAGHRLYWHGKGYETTMRVLDTLARRYPVEVIVVRDRQMSHAQALAAKRRAHIVIDECVTGSYHRNSLEGLACGCVVVNGVGLRPEIAKVLKRCAGGDEMPFVFSQLKDLEETLEQLIVLGPVELAERGAASRRWIESHWQFAVQWERDWEPVAKAALARASSATAALPAPTARRAAGRRSISIVIPHGGRERLELLGATIGAVAPSTLVKEIIVAEMDEAPNANDLARRLNARYVFIRSDAGFNKARSVNVGSAMASGELVLWLDNDLLLPEGFLDRAVAELQERGLDCLIPWTTVYYLGVEDTRAVGAGTQSAAVCRPVNAYHTRLGACGGAVLLRHQLFQKIGGLCEEFRGWGGEDNAWLHKAHVLGRAAITARSDQFVYHLFHPRSGGYGSQDHIAANPHYQANVALLHAIRRITDRKQFLARYPPPDRPPCPWERSRTVGFLAAPGDDQARARLQAARDGLRDRFAVDTTDLSGDGDLASDAIVVFGAAAADRVANQAQHRLVVVDEGGVAALPGAAHRVAGDEPDLAAALIGPLSLILGARAAQKVAAAVGPSAGTAVVVAASGIGDLLRVTPLIRVLAQLGFRVDFLIAADYPDTAQLFEGAPEINRVKLLPPLTGRAEPARISDLAAADYDVGVVTHLAAAFAPQVRARSQHLFDRDKWLARGDAGCVESIARALGWQQTMPEPIARPSARRFDLPEGTVVLHPGCKRNWPWKRWHGFAELASLLQSVAIVGTEEDRAATGAYFRGRGGWPAHVRDYTGLLSLPDTAALIAEAAALVSNDSGLMHLGAAVGRPTFGIFGITNPAREIIATPHMHVITKGLACEPDCRTQPYGRRDCEHHLSCLKQLTAAEVFDAMQRLMPRPLPAMVTPAPHRLSTARAAAEILTVAIQLEGGLGDIIISAGLVEALYVELGHCEIDVFHHMPDWAKFVFRDARFVRNVFPASLHRTTGARYDIAVSTLQFVHYRVNDWAKLERLNSAVAAKIRVAGERLEQYRGLFDRRPNLDALWARISLAQGRAALTNVDFLGGLASRSPPSRFLALDPLAAEHAWRLIGDKVACYITVHDGFDTTAPLAAGTATKLWPLEHWASFVAEFKRVFPQIAVVQLGAGKSRSIAGVDVNLIGRTTLDQAAWLLKRAALHIDTDSGLVHLAKFVHTRSIVLFGPTDADFYGYDGNCNIVSSRCGKCWWSTPDWLARCPRGLKQPDCMASIAPASVLDQAHRHLEHRCRPNYRLVARQLYDAISSATTGSLIADIFAQLGIAPVPICRHAVDPHSGIYLHASKQWEYPFALSQIASLGRCGALRIADVGGGRGALAPYLAKLGHQVEVFDRDYQWDHGGDPSVEQRYMRWAADQGYTARYGSLYNLPTEDARYDVVLSISVIEHIYAKQLAICELLRIVKPGGLVILTFDFALDPARFRDSLRLEIFGPELLAQAFKPFGVVLPDFTSEEICDSARAIQRDAVLGIPEGMTVGGISIARL
jgi:ADP-heptose:LPS heptosyltransferase/SAM-dependent methyltransferase